MVTEIPSPNQKPPPPDLDALLNLADSPWQKRLSKKPGTRTINKEARKHENWLAREWKPLLQSFARDLEISHKQNDRWHKVFTKYNLDSTKKTVSFEKIGLLASYGKLSTGTIKQFVKKRRLVEREEIWPFWQQYFMPYLDGNTSEIERMLSKLAQGGEFIADADDKMQARLPSFIYQQEEEHDKELLKRWIGNPPVKPKEPVKPAKPTSLKTKPATKQAQKDHRAAWKKYSKDRKTYSSAMRRYKKDLKTYKKLYSKWSFRKKHPELGSAIIGAGVGEPPISATELKKKMRADLKTVQAQGNALIIMAGGEKRAANLYMSQVAPIVYDYLRPLFMLLSGVKEIYSVYWGMLNIAYFLVAYALIPVPILWRDWHGTDCIEKLIPQQAKTTQAAQKFISAPEFIHHLLPKSQQEKRPKLKKVLLAYQEFLKKFLAKEEQHRLEFLRFIGRYSGGRVLLPASEPSEPGFSGDGVWNLEVNTTDEAGSPAKKVLQAKEVLFYEKGKGPKKHPERNYVLPNIWPQLRTAVALCNQSGANFWFNDVDNRWGGRNWPHNEHRLGTSIDFDVGFLGENGKGTKVPNIKNKGKVDCLVGIDRLVTWIGIQAFLLIGASTFIYADKGLMDEASMHLWRYFKVPLKRELEPENYRVGRKPKNRAKLKEWEERWNKSPLAGKHDKAHSDHIHFEVAVTELLTKVGDFVWVAQDTPDLFSRLYELAIQRDNDPFFWLRMAGLDDVPKDETSFDQLAQKGVKVNERERWKDWWARRQSKEGIPLLPIWSPDFAPITRDFDSCTPLVGDHVAKK